MNMRMICRWRRGEGGRRQRETTDREVRTRYRTDKVWILKRLELEEGVGLLEGRLPHKEGDKADGGDDKWRDEVGVLPALQG